MPTARLPPALSEPHYLLGVREGPRYPKEWLEAVEADEALADTSVRPTGPLVASAFAATARLAEAAAPQRRILGQLMERLEEHAYPPLTSPSASRSSLYPDSEDSALSAQRTRDKPYCEIVMEQQDALNTLHTKTRQLHNIIHRAEKLEIMRAGLTLAIFQGKGMTVPSITALGKYAISTAITLFVFALWRVCHAEIRRARRRKAEMLAHTLHADVVQPFKCWQIFAVEQRVLAQQSTQQAFGMEGRMLSVEVRDLESQQEDLKCELQMSLGTTRRLQARLDTETRARVALAARFAQARPELVRATLASALNLAFAAALREAILGRIMCWQVLSTRDLASLLHSTEEETLARVANQPVESLLIRWVNYHIMQCKLGATEVLESVQRSRAEEMNGPSAGGTSEVRLQSEWSARDVEIYCDRCRQARVLQRITNLGEDLKDGTALAVLYASIVCSFAGLGRERDGGLGTIGGITGGTGAFGLNPAALWPLDEKDPEQRAVKLVTAFRQILPTQAAVCILRPTDITKGTPGPIVLALSSLFLHSCRLPSSVLESQVGDYVGTAIGEVTLPPTEVSTTGGTRLENSSSNLTGFAFSPRYGDPSASTVQPIRQVVTTMETAASKCAYAALQDLTPLVQQGEVLEHLHKLPCDEFLLRWLNVKLERPPAERIRSLRELRGPVVLLELFRKVASDVLSLIPEAKAVTDGKKEDEPASQVTLQTVVIECGNRCTSFQILTPESLTEPQTDVIAAFLAGLFLCRPGLDAGPKSPLKVHVDLIADAVKGGDQENHPGFPGLCSWLQDHRDDLRVSMQAVEAARDLHSRMEEQLYIFQVDLLTQRAQGSPCKTLGLTDEREKQHEAARTQLVSATRLQEIVESESTPAGIVDEYQLERMREQLEDLIRKNHSLFVQMFKHYSTGLQKINGEQRRASNAGRVRGSTMVPSLSARMSSLSLFTRPRMGKDAESRVLVVDLRGLTRVLKDCRLRSLKVTAADVEVAYHEVRMDHFAGGGAGVQGGLSLEGFVEALILIGGRAKVDNKMDRAKTGPLGIHERFGYVVDKHFWPLATRGSEDLFYTMAHDPGINPVVTKYDRLLRAVFQTYAGMGVQAIETLRETARMAVQSFSRVSSRAPSPSALAAAAPSSPTGPTNPHSARILLDINGCQAMLEHAGLFTDQLDMPALRTIFKGVQQEEVAHAEDGDSDMQDSSDGDSDKDDEDSEDGEDMGGDEGGAIVSDADFPMIAYQEFIDVLVVVVMYKEPNPFVPFTQRFERLITEALLVPLKNHWLERCPESGLGPMLKAGLIEIAKGPSKRR